MSASPPLLDRRALLLRGVGVILLASFLFGAMAICVRLAAREMPSVQVAFIRFAGSLVALLAFTRGRGLRPRPGNVPRLIQRGALGGGSIMLYYFGIQQAGAGLATLVYCTYPVWATLFAGLFMGEDLSGRIAVALLISLAGVVIVIGGIHGAGVGLGAVSVLAASVLAGGAVATARSLRATESASLITTHFMIIGAIMTAPAMLFGLPAISTPLALALAGVILSSVVGQWLLHQGLGFASAAQGSLAAATSVLTAAGLEALFLGEHLHGSALIGAVLMIGAIALAASRSHDPTAAAERAPIPTYGEES